MIKRFFAGMILVAMFGAVVYNLSKNEMANKNSDMPVEIEDENFDGVIYAAPDDAALQKGASAKVNKMAPDFTLDTLDGGKLTLSELQGKKVFLNFWATWCSYCIDEMPAMQKFYEKYKDEVVVIGVNATGSEVSVEQVKNYVDQLNITFPVVLDRELELTYNKYQAFAIPTTFFINTKGIIQLEKKVGPMDYEFMVDQLKKLN
jgi:thiol-disulfide isomerase/thioredoxin